MKAKTQPKTASTLPEKTRIAVIAVLIALTFSAQAQTTGRAEQPFNRFLIDLTPGGFDERDADNWPQAWIDFLNAQVYPQTLWFFDQMFGVPYEIGGITYPPGWVSRFGMLNGGTYFFAYIDRTGPVPTAVIRWDMRGSGYVLGMIYVHDEDTGFSTLYQVRSPMKGSGYVTFDGVKTIESIAFYGAPDQ